MEINYIDQRPEISIVDDTVILSLTLQDNAASTAINAANEAEASALAAGLSEQNALDSEQAAAQSESNAAGSATAASQSATNALASEQNAAQSESNAATSASTATTQAGIATTKASEASQSATDALASAQAAAASELDAEAARDEIVSKIDFTGASEGDIFRVNSLGVAVKINETEFLKSTVPFLKSPLAGLVDLDSVFAWDSFDRPTISIGNADSGQPWLSLALSPFIVASRAARGSVNTGSIAVIERSLPISTTDPYRGGVGVWCNYFYRANHSRVVVMKDANNYFFYNVFFDTIIIGKVINGVETTILNRSVNRYTNSHGSIDFKLQRNTEVQRLFLTVLDSCDGVQRRIDLTNEYATFIPEDWRYIGFFTPTGNIAQSVFYKNVIMYNL